MTATTKKSVALWTVQVLLAALFLFAGVSKFLLPVEVLQQGPVRLPVGFLLFIGMAEIAGAIGLILPGLLHIRRVLTPVAALGLVIIMSGATAITVQGGTIAPALVPFIVGVLAASVAYGRRSWTPLR
jgi:uncharacterized membrane protein YphA (DoxX/SURF4 family)